MASSRPITHSPLLPSSNGFRLDNNLASNAYEELPASISSKTNMSTGKEPARHYKSQLQNQTPRYRTMSHDGRLNPKVPEANHPRRQRPARYNSDFSPPPPFIYNAGHALMLRGFSNPHLPNHLRPTSRAKLASNFYDSQIFWLGLYFAFNLGLTIFNKGVLLQFPFPYTLTAIHALCGSIGGFLLLESGLFVSTRLGTKDAIALVAFSVLYAVNIAVSNMSLQLVTVPVRYHLHGDKYFLSIQMMHLVPPSCQGFHPILHDRTICFTIRYDK
jgi:hypothetical protein